LLKVCVATSIIGLSTAGEFHILKDVLGEIDEALKKQESLLWEMFDLGHEVDR